MMQKGQTLIFILLGIVIAAFVGVAFYAGKITPKPPVQNPAVTSTPQPTASPSPTPDETATWRTYISQDGKYTLKYPQDWVLEDNSRYVDIYQDKNFAFQHEILISKNKHIFKSYNPLASGPWICIYSDSSSVEGPQERYGDYTEIKNSHTIYRRSKDPVQESDNVIKWEICKKDETSSDNFSIVAGFGYISYETPIQYDTQLLQTMDQILMTFKQLK